MKLFREIIVVCMRSPRIRLYVGFAKASCFFEQNLYLEEKHDKTRTIIKKNRRSSWRIPRGETRWFWNFSWNSMRIPSIIMNYLEENMTESGQWSKKNLIGVLKEFRLEKPDGFRTFQELLWEFLHWYYELPWRGTWQNQDNGWHPKVWLQHFQWLQVGLKAKLSDILHHIWSSIELIWQ